MEEASSQLLPILQALLPGFVTTATYYWLSNAPKPSQFERIIEALLYSAVIKLLFNGMKIFALWLGQWINLGGWPEGYETALSLLLAAFVGLALAHSTIRGALYRLARYLKLTTRDFERLDEWGYAISSFPNRGIVLNMLDGRRLMGYPRIWPADPNGHFLMELPHWLVGETARPCVGISFILISNIDVLWVEILESPEVTT